MSKFCEYCMNYDTDKTVDTKFGMSDIISCNPLNLRGYKGKKAEDCMWVGIYDGKLKISVHDIDFTLASRKIKYCPMCGRKL